VSIKITERSLYDPILRLFEEVGREFGVHVLGVPEVSTGEGYPDILIQIDGHKVLVQVKIDKASRLLDDIVKSYPIAKRLGADLIVILFSTEVREIVPQALNAVAPQLTVARTLILTPWISTSLERVKLQDVIKRIVKSFIDYRKTLSPSIDYMTVAYIARETIEDLANALRGYMGAEKYSDIAQAVVGRFDFYRSLLEEFVEDESVMRTYLADIIAYLIVLQLLFGHIVSLKRYKQSVLPDIDNPLSIPDNLIDDIESRLRSTGIDEEYKDIIGSLPHILDILRKISSQDRSILTPLGRYIYTIKVLKPEHVREELLGRIYQEGLPPETRKNLGAFFTKPRAAKLLAELAVDRWDEKVLDPACGSGTLLVEAYWAKMKRAEEEGVNLDRDHLHEVFVEKHITGIDIMQFAKELATINLALQNIYSKAVPRIYYGDGITKMVQAVKIQEDDPPASGTLMDYVKFAEERYKELSLPYEGFDLVIMNPPFTRRERIPEKERERIDKLLGKIARGKVGYWAYFFVAADNVIKLGGKLAAVTPEEFIVGGDAESVRRFLFEDKGYVPKYIVKSSVEPAFSEQTKYRDYLIVFRKYAKSGDSGKTMIIVLKKSLHSECDDKCLDEIVKKVREFENSNDKAYSSDIFDAWKTDFNKYVHIYGLENLKPLVAPYSVEFYELLEKLTDVFSSLPLLRDYLAPASNALEAHYYNPGQYKAKDVEDYARALIIPWHYKRITGKSVLKLIEIKDNFVKLGVKTKGKIEYVASLPKTFFVPAFRSYSNVKHLDITNEEDLALIGINDEIIDVLRAKAGLTDVNKISQAVKDIKAAYNDLAGNIILFRKFQIPSPGLYWIALYSENRVLGTTDYINVKLKKLNREAAKVLVLYLNSIFTIIQVLSLREETRGGWGRFDLVGMWDRVHIPDVASLPDSVLKDGLSLYDVVKKMDVPPLDERLRSMHDTQVNIDLFVAKLLGMEMDKDKLFRVYKAVLKELEILENILRALDEKEHKTTRQVKRSTTTEKAETRTTLDRWMRY